MGDATGGIAVAPVDEQQPSPHIEGAAMIEQLAGSEQ